MAGFMVYGIIKYEDPYYPGILASIERDYWVYTWQQGIKKLRKVALYYKGKAYILHYGQYKPISKWPEKRRKNEKSSKKVK